MIAVSVDTPADRPSPVTVPDSSGDRSGRSLPDAMGSGPGTIADGLRIGLWQSIDNASVTFFRIAFGGLMAAWAWNYLASGRVTNLYVEPAFLFTYFGFDWVKPWPGSGMYLHFAAILVFALMIAAGCFYRLATIGFALSFVYVFLLDRTNYQNHYYLIGLFGCLLTFLPLHRNVSVDAWRKPEILSQTVPAWVLWAIRFHVAVPYFFGGVAKLTPDWLLGQPMGLYLSTKTDIPVIGTLLSWQGAGIATSWFGLFFDLLIVPALLWRRTRVPAYLLSVAFHLTNSMLFQIHVFPWFMIVATTMFFEPDWPRRVLSVGRGQPVTSHQDAVKGNGGKRPSRWVLALVLGYLLFHCLWPLRGRFYGSETSWDERGHLFSWRMMLRAKEVGIGYAVVDPRSGKVANVDHKQFIDEEQAGKFARDPEMILMMGRFIADRFESEMGWRPQVHAFALASLNGRKPQLLIDPNVDLAAETRGQFGRRDWVMPLTEPLRLDPWNLPVEQWRQHVELPEIGFLKNASASE